MTILGTFSLVFILYGLYLYRRNSNEKKAKIAMKIDFYLDQDVDTMFPDHVSACENRFYNQKYQKDHHILRPAHGELFEIFFIHEK